MHEWERQEHRSPQGPAAHIYKNNENKSPLQTLQLFNSMIVFGLTPRIPAPNRVLEASWGVWGASKRPLGASWARLEASWAHLEASSSNLEASWSVLERLGGVLGPKVAASYLIFN